MTTQTVSITDYAIAVQQMSSQLASGWSEAGSRFAQQVAAEGGRHVAEVTRQHEILAAELGAGFRNAANAAQDWAQAARASNHEGAARVYDKFAERYYQKANDLLEPVLGSKAALDGVAREARNAAQDAEKVLGGKLGRVLGPAFDAAQMIAGLWDWIDTGNSDKFGGAAMGVALSAGFGIIGVAVAGAIALPAIAVAVVAGVAAIVGSMAGDYVFGLLSESVNGFFLDARNLVIRRDPLVFDLDGDGLELTGASGAILFDHNADNIKTGTGWAKADDGFLVRDLDGNGLIDTGRELFGVDTIKSNNTLATQGFDALSELDSNADGQITNLDAAYGELKVWQDSNQDGISQSTELKTLAEQGITRIGLNGTSTGPQAGQVINNNRVALSTTFTRNGQTRTVGAIDLEANNFFTEFPPQVVDEAGNPVAITAQAQGLPQMNGAGMVRHMRAAASLNGDFANTLATFAATTTREGQRSQLDELITQWAATADFKDGRAIVVKRKIAPIQVTSL